MLPRAVLGGGCFWCLEATFQRLKGVQKVESGYAGGKTQNPTYNDVTSGLTNHAEVVRIHYDPSIISYHGTSPLIQNYSTYFSIFMTPQH